MSNLSTRAGNIRKFEIYQAKDGGGFVDASGAVTDIKYYEDILSNSISLILYTPIKMTGGIYQLCIYVGFMIYVSTCD